MALETTTFSGELQKLDDCRTKFMESLKALREFILSAAFLVDYMKFESLLGDFQDKIVTLVEAAETPVPGLPPYEAVKGGEKEEAEEVASGKWSWWRFVAVAFVNVACYVAVEQRILSFQFFEFVIVLSIVLMFLPQIVDLIHHLTGHGEEEEEEKAESMRLEDWIHETLAKMRSKYKSARFLMKVQNQTGDMLPQYKALGVDEAMYNRSAFFNETLPHELMSQIGEIEIACDKNLWTRRSLILMAIVQAKQASMAAGQHGGMHPT
jgi:hypothetical protein